MTLGKELKNRASRAELRQATTSGADFAELLPDLREKLIAAADAGEWRYTIRIPYPNMVTDMRCWARDEGLDTEVNGIWMDFKWRNRD
jgi:hypothetical protein